MSTSPARKYLVGARHWRPRWLGHGAQLWVRWRYPLTRRTVLSSQGRFNAKDLSREIKVLDKRPLWWLLGLSLLAVLPFFPPGKIQFGGGEQFIPAWLLQDISSIYRTPVGSTPQ
jgi:branched-chain amino acid transport system permease protein